MGSYDLVLTQITFLEDFVVIIIVHT